MRTSRRCSPVAKVRTVASWLTATANTFSPDAELIHAIVHAIGSDFWQPYVEEWAVPPLERAQRNADKVKFYRRIQHPLFRLLILRCASRSFVFLIGHR